MYVTVSINAGEMPGVVRINQHVHMHMNAKPPTMSGREV